MIIRSISGVRGTAPEFNSESVTHYAQAFHTLQPKGVIMLGRDTRPSGEAYIEDIAVALVSAGRDVINLNIVPTPTVQFMVENTDAVGGIIVTASHNPTEWNGLKFVSADGTFLIPDECAELFAIVDGVIPKSNQEPGLHYPDVNAIQKHVIKVANLSCVKQNIIRKRNFKVVLDAVNGAAFEALPYMLESLGCEVIKIHCNGTGQFDRPPEPLPENLSDLKNEVLKTGANVGFASDPDGDRLAIILEDGRPAGDEYSLVMAADGYLQTVGKPEVIVTNLSTTLALEKVAERYGSTVERSAVGEINVVQKMIESGSNLGGEGNGGVILKEAHLGRDSLVAATMILHRMAMTVEPISAIYDGLPQFEIVKDRIELAGIDIDSILKKAKTTFSDAAVNEIDGIKFSWHDRWIHLRSSNTEPIMRIYAEGPTKAEAQGLIDQIRSKL